MIGRPAIVAGHSLGAIVAAALGPGPPPAGGCRVPRGPAALRRRARVFPSDLLPGLRVLRDHIAQLQAERAPVDTYRDLLAASPHPAGDRLGDHLHDDALWSRAGALAGPTPRPSAPCSTGPRSPATTPSGRFTGSLVVRPTPPTTPPSDPTTSTGCSAPRPTSRSSRCPAPATTSVAIEPPRPLPRRPHRLPHPPTGHDLEHQP